MQNIKKYWLVIAVAAGAFLFFTTQGKAIVQKVKDLI